MRRLAVVLVLAGCDWSLHRMQDPVSCTVHGTTAQLPHGSCDLEPPDGTVAMDLATEPPPVTRTLLVRGRDRFDRICAACHGPAADGDSQIARVMTRRRPPSLVGDGTRKLDDPRILAIIATGYGLMPAYGTMVALPDRYALLHYIRALQQREVVLGELSPEQQAEALRWLR